MVIILVEKELNQNGYYEIRRKTNELPMMFFLQFVWIAATHKKKFKQQSHANKRKEKKLPSCNLLSLSSYLIVNFVSIHYLSKY